MSARAAGDVKILDFGLARFRDPPPARAHLTDEGIVLGTPAYMSPEQIRGTPVTAGSDLFSLGIVIYELVSGMHPFAGADPASTIAQHSRVRAGPPCRSATRGAAECQRRWASSKTSSRRVCARLPEHRFRSAHDLIEALERARGAMSGRDQRAARRTETALAIGGGRALVVAVPPGDRGVSLSSPCSCRYG